MRGKIAIEQIKFDLEGKTFERTPPLRQNNLLKENSVSARSMPQRRTMNRVSQLTVQQKGNFKKMLDDLMGTRGAYLLDEKMNILGKVPGSELVQSIKDLNSVYAVIFDGAVSDDIVQSAELSNVEYIIGMNSKVNSESQAEILTTKDLA